MCKSYGEQRGMQKLTLQEAPPKWKIKEYCGIFRFSASLLCVHLFVIVVELWHETF